MYHEYVNSYPSRSGGRLTGEQNSGRTEQAGAVGGGRLWWQQQFGHYRRITGRPATNTRAANEYGPYKLVKKNTLSEKMSLPKINFVVQ